MSIKSEKFPDWFEELFKRFDSQDRDKKDVAFLILEEIIAENKALSNDFRFQVNENCRIASQLNSVEESRDELLSALKVAAEAEEKEGYIFNDTIQRAEALQEKTK